MHSMSASLADAILSLSLSLLFFFLRNPIQSPPTRLAADRLPCDSLSPLALGTKHDDSVHPRRRLSSLSAFAAPIAALPPSLQSAPSAAAFDFWLAIFAIALSAAPRRSRECQSRQTVSGHAQQTKSRQEDGGGATVIAYLCCIFIVFSSSPLCAHPGLSSNSPVYEWT